MNDRAMQRMIFAACKQLGLDEDARRDMQVSVTGKSSMSDMTDTELKLVVNRLKQDGFKDFSKRGSKRRHKAAPRSDLRFVHVLWRLLGEAGKLKTPGRDGLNSFVRVRFGEAWGSVPRDIDDLRDAGQINAVVRALIDWCEREDIPLDRDGSK